MTTVENGQIKKQAIGKMHKDKKLTFLERLIKSISL